MIESMQPASRYLYRFGGVVIDSCVPIGLLSLADDEPQESYTPRINVKISSQPLLPVGEFVYSWPGRQDLYLYKISDAWVFRYSTGIEFGIDDDGSIITCFTGTDGFSQVTSEMLVRRILPRVIALQDRQVIHAASLATPNGGILLCGQSHAGKSTLAASLSHNLGWGLMDDDTSILTVHGQSEDSYRFKLHSVAARVGLWPDSHQALSAAMIYSEEMSAVDGKYRCEFPNQIECEGQELKAIYQLDSYSLDDNPTGEILIESLSPQDATALLVRHQVRFYPSDAAAEMNRFTSLAKMARSVLNRTLRYPRSYDRLREVCLRLEKDMGSFSRN